MKAIDLINLINTIYKFTGSDDRQRANLYINKLFERYSDKKILFEKFQYNPVKLSEIAGHFGNFLNYQNKFQESFNFLIQFQEYFPQIPNSENVLIFPNAMQVACEQTGNLVEMFRWELYPKHFPHPFEECSEYLPSALYEENIYNKKLLILPDQGLGDKILFSQSIDFIAPKIKRGLVITNDSLIRIYKKLYGCHKNLEFMPTSKANESQFIHQPEINTQFDSQCYLSDLFNWQVLSLNKIPQIKTIYDGSEIDKNGRIAIVPFSIPAKKQDKDLKSIPGEYFDEYPEDYIVTEIIPTNFNKYLHSDIPIMSQTNDFLDTLSLLRKSKCLVTADTSVAHLGGFFGIETYVIIKDLFDWRWKFAKLYSSTHVVQLKDLPELLEKLHQEKFND